MLLKEVYRVFKICGDIYEVDFGHEDSEGNFYTEIVRGLGLEEYRN